MAFKGNNGKYLSRFTRSGIDNAEFAKDNTDQATRFLAIESDGKLLLKSNNGKYLSRIYRRGISKIEAAKETPDDACRFAVHNRDFKIHYGGLLLRLLRPWGTRLTAPFPPQTSNSLRFRCTATGCSTSTCLYKNGYGRLYSTFIRQRFDHWQRFPSLVSILHLPKLRFASQLLIEPL